MIVSGAQDVSLRSGEIIDAGSATDYDGATVAATSTTENFGIAAKAGSTTKIGRFGASNVNVVDTRSTPLTNYAVWLTGVADSWWENVRGIRTRQTSRTTKDSFREVQGRSNWVDPQRFLQTADFVNVSSTPVADTAGRLFMEGGVLKWREPSGAVRTVSLV